MKQITETTLSEFEKFINFIKDENPKLSAKLGVLGKKDSYKLNSLLHYKRNISDPFYTQLQYPVIDLMFSLALDGGLYVKANDEKGQPALIKTSTLESFELLTPYEKYVFLLQTYWTKYPFDEKLDRSVYIDSLFNILDSITKAKKGQKIKGDTHRLDRCIFSYGNAFLYHLRFFGLGELEEIEDVKDRYEASIAAFIPNEFGKHISKFLTTKALHLWGHIDLQNFIDKKRIKSVNIEDVFEVFKEIFNDESVVNTVIQSKYFDRSGVYTFKVSLSKSCWRKITVSHLHSLYDLHYAIQTAFDFDNDHLHAFFLDGNYRTGKPICCSETGTEEKSTDETYIGDMGLYIGQKLYYLFDFGDKWEFSIDLISIEKSATLPAEPVIIERKGEAPD